MEVFKPNHHLFDQVLEYNYRPNFLEIDGVNMHYVDIGSGPVMLMLHGMPTWGYLYRDFIKPLSEAGYRCIIPDHIGFGRSDKPADTDYFTIERHCNNLSKLIEHLNLTDITLICQDWGGPIGLHQAACMPDRFERLAIMNTWLAHDDFRYSEAIRNWNNSWRNGGLFDAAPNLCTIVPMLSAGQYDRSHLSEVVSGREQLEDTIPDDMLSAWKAWSVPFIPYGKRSLPDAESEASGIYSGARMFPLSLPFDDPIQANQVVQNENYLTLLKWRKPAHFFWGCEDDVFTEKWGRSWSSSFFISTFNPFINAGHFLQNTHGKQIANSLISLINKE